jgi:putative DNA methylase
MPNVAQLVSAQIQAGKQHYILHSWVIMPNHVHLLITPSIQVSKITRSLKGATARQANLLLNRTGPFWQDESYDHLVRNPEEFRRIENYIIQNPVRAGLATSPEEFPWSSASCGARL